MANPIASPTGQIIFPITPYYRRKSSSKCSIILGILFIIFFVLCIAVVVVWAVLSDGFHNLGGFPDLCATKACISAASRLTASMGDNASACEDFYQLSCGRYHQSSEQLSYSEMLMDATLNNIHGLISARSSGDGANARSFEMVHQLYVTCMDVERRNNLGSRPFLAALRNFPCGPIFIECTSFNADFYSFERHAGMLDWLAGPANLIYSDREIHPGDRGKIVLSLKTPKLDEMLWETKSIMASIAQPGLSEYEPLMIVTLKQQLLNPVYGQIFQDGIVIDQEVLIDEVAELIIELDKMFSNADMRPAMVTTISQLMTDVPQINWQVFLNAKFSTNLQWNVSDSVFVDSIDSFRDLAAIVARTPRRALANYLTFMTALNLRGYLFNATMRTQPLHWRECIQQLAALEPTAKVYVQARQDLNFQEINSLLGFMKTTFVDEHSKFPLAVLNRIKNSFIKIGYPQRILNENAVMHPYNAYEVIPDDYFTSIVTALSRQRIAENAMIGEQLDNDDTIRYGILSAHINYNANENTFVVPVSFLQYPMSFPGDAPYYTIYGTLGVVFTQILAKIFWSASESAILMSQAMQCMEHPFLTIQSSSSLALGQQQTDDIIYAIHLSDAVNSVVNGYSSWRSQNRVGEEARLPSLQDYNTVQQLFLSFSTLFCNVSGRQVNSTYRAIINAVGFNSNAFTHSFKCSTSSRLYNRRTCT